MLPQHEFGLKLEPRNIVKLWNKELHVKVQILLHCFWRLFWRSVWKVAHFISDLEIDTFDIRFLASAPTAPTVPRRCPGNQDPVCRQHRSSTLVMNCVCSAVAIWYLNQFHRCQQVKSLFCFDFFFPHDGNHKQLNHFPFFIFPSVVSTHLPSTPPNWWTSISFTLPFHHCLSIFSLAPSSNSAVHQFPSNLHFSFLTFSTFPFIWFPLSLFLVFRPPSPSLQTVHQSPGNRICPSPPTPTFLFGD